MCDVPKLAKKYAYACALGNLLISGSGTIASSFLQEGPMNKTQFIIGLFQFLLSPYLIGYLWSLWWIYKLIMAANRGGAGESLEGRMNSTGAMWETQTKLKTQIRSAWIEKGDVWSKHNKFNLSAKHNKHLKKTLLSPLIFTSSNSLKVFDLSSSFLQI